MIKIGDRLPEVTLVQATAEARQPVTTTAFFAGKTVALLAVPGAFTPTCSAKHLPGFRDRAHQLQAKGVDVIACTAVNDGFVLGAWAKDQDLGDRVVMLADGNADFARSIGLDSDRSQFHMGTRSRRYSMLIKDGVVERLNVEEGGEFKVSSAEYLLEQLG
jgi:peroxiredoxin